MSFSNLKETWSTLGEVDPLWAILTDPTKENGQWDVDEFFRTGRAEISHVLQEIHYSGFTLQGQTALDFGCGVGRLTQALCPHFAEVHGVDIAETMIMRANNYNQYPGKCTYHVNQDAALTLFADNTFDFIYSRIVLQHIPPVYSKQYIAEFVRILKPGGLLIFQLPTELRKPELDATLSAYVIPSCIFSAQITTVEKRIALKSGETQSLPVRLKNTSKMNWTAVQTSSENMILQLGCHWLQKNGDVYQYDGPRTPLAVDLQPGAETDMVLAVTAPATGGDYLLELDMVCEGVAWFYDYGSPTTILSAKVQGKQSNKLPSLTGLSKKVQKFLSFPAPANSTEKEINDHAEKPAFEMHGVSAVEVSKIIQEKQGQIIALQQEFSAGRNWPGYYYFVTKQ